MRSYSPSLVDRAALLTSLLLPDRLCLQPLFQIVQVLLSALTAPLPLSVQLVRRQSEL